MFKTQLNKFGLYHVYHMTHLPTYDPDDAYTMEHPPVVHAVHHNPESPYHPYLNQNSFHLGE